MPTGSGQFGEGGGGEILPIWHNRDDGSFFWVGLCLGRNAEEWLEGRTPGCQLKSAEKRNAPFPIRYKTQHVVLRGEGN
jgi:hypothetical protein